MLLHPSSLYIVGNLPDANVFRVAASDLVGISEIVLSLPGFMAAVNQSIKAGTQPPSTSVIINVLYDKEYTGHGTDPNGTLSSTRALATRVSLRGFGMSGLFAEPVSDQACNVHSPRTRTLLCLLPRP
jgi:hypothetical protein